jgi:hypothetical protein
MCCLPMTRPVIRTKSLTATFLVSTSAHW